MKKLKIRTHGLFGTTHSWALTMRYLFAQFEKMGHELYINSTNGLEGVPKSWYKYFRDCQDPDIDICYTLPINFKDRFAKKAKCRMAIYNYESSIFPAHWTPNISHVDYLLPSSNYVKKIFLDAGMPESKIAVVPLGIDTEYLDGPLDDFQLKTSKRFKLLSVSIPHARKNINVLVNSFLEEFNDNDDICLVLKTSTTPRENSKYEVDVNRIVSQAKERFGKAKNVSEIEIVDKTFSNIATIYKKCNATINVASAEGFGLPLIEAMYCGNLVAATDYGGVKDFLNASNSLPIQAVEAFAPPTYQYWHASRGAVVGFPVAASIKATMRKLFEQEKDLHAQFNMQMKDVVERFTWTNTAEQIIKIFKSQEIKNSANDSNSENNSNQIIDLNYAKKDDLCLLSKNGKKIINCGEII